MAPKAKAKAEAPAKAEPKAKSDGKKKEKVERPKPEEEIPRVPQPDNEEFKEKLNKIAEAIDALNKEQAKLTARINERNSGKTEFFAQKGELRTQLNELSAKMDALQEKKDEINKAVGSKVQESKDMRQQLNKMKKSIGYSTESEIDDRIATIEFKLWTDSISLKEEKKYLQEIQELKRNRPKVSQVNRMEEGLQTFDKGSSLKGDINSINEEMFKLREQKRAIQAKLTELMDGRKEQLGDLPDVIAKKEELGKQIGEKVKERNEIRDEYKAAEKAYYAYQAELRRIRYERQAEERQKYQAEAERRATMKKAEKLDEQPYVSEITLIEQTILFCKSLQPKDAGEKEEKKEQVIDAPEGTQMLMKKEERDEFWFAPTAKKKAKGGKKAGGESGSKKPIKHNAETFRLFDQLKLDAPITTDDIPAALEKLEAQLEEYQAKVKKWEETREEKKRRILEGLEDPDEEKKEEAKEEAKEDKEEEKEGEKEEDKAED